MPIWGLKRLCHDPKVATTGGRGFRIRNRIERRKKSGVHQFSYSHPRPEEIKVKSTHRHNALTDF